MEAVKDQQRQGKARDDAPSQVTVKGELQLLRHPIVRHERIQQPQRDVGKEQEGDDLSSRFEQHLVAGSADAFTRLSDEHSLQRRLN